jgi:methylisocitrate lyase
LGLDEAIERGRMAADLGVDAVFVEAPESIDELDKIARALSGAVLVAKMVERGRTPLLSIGELDELGFRLVVSPLSGLFSAVRALETAYARLHAEGSLREHLDGLVGFDDFAELVGLDDWRGLDQADGSSA